MHSSHFTINKSVQIGLFILLLIGSTSLVPTNSNKPLDSNTVMWSLNERKIAITSSLQKSDSSSSSASTSVEATVASLNHNDKSADSNDTGSLKEQNLMLEFIKVQILNKLGMNEAPKIGSEKIKITACKWISSVDIKLIKLFPDNVSYWNAMSY